jgi:hypothetical protein
VAFSDFTFNKNNADIICAIDGSSPLIGSGSLRLSNVDNKTVPRRVHGYYTSNVGFARGKIRTLVNIAASSNRTRAGLYCCGSQANLASAGNVYYAAFESDSSGGNRRLRLWKATTGFDEDSVTPATALLTAVAHPAFTLGTTKALELEWHASLTLLGGTRLIVRVGDETDFSDLDEVADYTDVTSPYTTCVAEGVFLLKWDTQTDLAEARFDSTRLVQLT